MRLHIHLDRFDDVSGQVLSNVFVSIVAVEETVTNLTIGCRPTSSNVVNLKERFKKIDHRFSGFQISRGDSIERYLSWNS